MLLVLDMGNTCITAGIYDKEDLRAVFRLSTDKTRTDDQYAAELNSLLDVKNIDKTAFEGCVICSVVPVLTYVMKNAIQKVIGVTPMIVGPGVKTGLNIKIDNPSQLGGDLVAGAVAAIAKYPLPCIIYDLGTATTISVVASNGDFLGGVITAGIGISLDALVSRTSQLPYVSLENVENNIIGTNTVSSIKSGLIYGTAAMIDGISERMEEEIGEKATLIATGGRAEEIIPYCKRKLIADEYLLLYGLKIIYEKNQ